MLEAAFLVNLVVFSSGALVIEQQEGNKDTLACISIGITFVLFLSITGYHVWKRLAPLLRKQFNKHRGYEDIDIVIRPQRPSTPPHQRRNFSRDSNFDLRESLLDTEI